MPMEELFQRAELLLGHDAMERLARQHVIIFGVGGVGSWCAEALVRSGVGHLTIVDGDRVCESNINRQLMATTATVGQPKVEALRRRFLDINPKAEITALEKVFTQETAADFALDDYDYVVDAIDSLRNKKELIVRACRSRAVLFSSMGAALKVDPTRIKVGEFSKVRDCPLGAMLRKQLRREGRFPQRKFLCVYGDELLEGRGVSPEGTELGGWDGAKARINGTTAHITAIFGMTLAGLVIKDIYDKATKHSTDNEG